MAKSANAAGTENQVVGKVFILYGTVKAVSPDGTVRVLAPNSPIYADDRIITESDGSVSLQFDGPPVTQLDLGRMTEIVIDEDVYAGVAPEVVSEAAAEAEQIQQSLLEGDQPIELEATAAGGVTGSGGGITVFNLDLDGSSVTPGSGAETTGITSTTVGTLGGVFGETPAPLYGVVTLTATESITEAAGQIITYTATVDNAPQGSDLVLTMNNGGTITIPAGETSGSAVGISAGDEDVYVDLSSITASITGATGGNYTSLDISDTATTSIIDTPDATTATITTADVNENAAGVTFNIHLSNPPQGAASASVLVGETVHTVAINAQGDGQLFIDTMNSDVYNDSQEVTARVTAINGGNYEATTPGASATAHVTDINAFDTTTITLSGPESVMEGDIITYTATVDNAPQGDLVITLDDDAGTQITILSGQLSGSSSPVAAPNVPDGGDTLTVAIADVSGGNYEALDTHDTVSVTIGDHTPEGGSVSAMVDDEGLSAGIPGGTDDIVVTPDADSDETTFSGTLAFDFGGDGAGLVTFADMDGTPGSIGTEEVTYTWDSDGNTLTATVSGGAREGTDLFTVEVTDATTGAYTVTLLDNVLHEAGGNENDAAAGLTYTVTDSDGSASTGTLNVTFNDDTPVLLGSETHSEGQGDQGHSGPVVPTYEGIPGPGEGGNTLVTFGDAGFGEQIMARNDDGSTGKIDVSSIFGTVATGGGMNLFGQTYDGFYINNNGNITFNRPMSTYTPFGITGVTPGIPNPMIAPFFADVDTRGAAGNVSEGGTSTGTNLVWYHTDTTNGVITITWDDVGYYSGHTDHVNAFQLRIFNQGDQNFSFEFRYENVDWTVGDVSGTAYARAGWTAGDGVNYYELPQSGDQAAILALETTSNPGTAIDGNWVFNVVEGEVTVLPVDGSTDTVTVEDEQALGGINETESPVDGVGHVDGNIVNNVNWGADGFGSATTVSVGGEDFTIDSVEGTTVYWSQEGTLLGTESGGAAASLLVNSDGTYTYTLIDNLLLGQDVQGEQPDVLATVSITGQDADGDTVAVSVTLQVQDDVPVVEMVAEANAIVEDEQLTDGIDETTDATPDLTATVSGNVSDNGSWGADGFGAVTQFQVGTNTAVTVSSGGSATVYFAQDGSYLGAASTGAAANLLVNSDGTYTFTLTDNMLIASGQGELVDTLGTVKFTGADADGDKATVNLTLQVQDDMPTAVNIDSNQHVSGTNTNLLIILDDSTSMGDLAYDSQGDNIQDGQGHDMTKLDVAKESIGQLFAAYDVQGDVMVKLVAFNSEVGDTGHWMTIDQATTALANLQADGNTDYDAALSTAMSAFGDPGNISGAQNVSYFLSDGEPNRPAWHAGIDGYGDGNSDVSVGEWTSFVDNNNIVSFALGMGSGANQLEQLALQSALDPIAYNGIAPADTNAIVVDQWSDLGQALVNTLHALPVSGALGSLAVATESSNFGADGGHVESITLDGHTYTYNPAGDGSISETGGPDGGHSTFDTATNELTVTFLDESHGKIAVDMDDGKFTYTPPAVITGDVNETIGFTLIDGDRDTASAQLNILIDDPADNP